MQERIVQLKADDPEEAKKLLEKVFKDSAEKQKHRGGSMGGLMRSKGFVWIATSQFFMGAWQQAGQAHHQLQTIPYHAQPS